MYNIKAFQEELDHSRTMIKSIVKSFESYTLPMKGKSIFNIIRPSSHAIWILDSKSTYHITPFPKLFNLYVKIIKTNLEQLQMVIVYPYAYPAI